MSFSHSGRSWFNSSAIFSCLVMVGMGFRPRLVVWVGTAKPPALGGYVVRRGGPGRRTAYSVWTKLHACKSPT